MDETIIREPRLGCPIGLFALGAEPNLVSRRERGPLLFGTSVQPTVLIQPNQAKLHALTYLSPALDVALLVVDMRKCANAASSSEQPDFLQILEVGE
jgi:hypothetical protein